MVEKPSVVFIQKTKCSEDKFKTMEKKICKNSVSITTDTLGAMGGLGIIWNPLGISLTNSMATKFTISAEFHILGTSSRGILIMCMDPSR